MLAGAAAALQVGVEHLLVVQLHEHGSAGGQYVAAKSVLKDCCDLRCCEFLTCKHFAI